MGTRKLVTCPPGAYIRLPQRPKLSVDAINFAEGRVASRPLGGSPRLASHTLPLPQHEHSSTRNVA
jgi:hypothetical protein